MPEYKHFGNELFTLKTFEILPDTKETQSCVKNIVCRSVHHALSLIWFEYDVSSNHSKGEGKNQKKFELIVRHNWYKILNLCLVFLKVKLKLTFRGVPTVLGGYGELIRPKIYTQ